jgi:hypothetical protein
MQPDIIPQTIKPIVSEGMNSCRSTFSRTLQMTPRPTTPTIVLSTSQNGPRTLLL